MLVSEIIASARDYHPSFRETGGGEAMLIRQINRMARRVLATIASETPEVVAEVHSIPKLDILGALSLDQPERKFEIPQFITLIPNARIVVNDGDPTEAVVKIVSLAHQYPDKYADPFVVEFPAFAVSHKAIYFTDQRRVGASAHGWDPYAGPLTFHYVPVPATVRLLTEDLDIAPGINDLVIIKLAEWLAQRHELPDTRIMIQAEYQVEMQAAIDLSLEIERTPGTWGVGG